MDWYKLEYDCETYEDVFTYATNLEWHGNASRPSSKVQWASFPSHLLKDSILKRLREFCSGMWLMRMEPRSLFREHMDAERFCGLHLCLHKSESCTFILEPDVYMDSEEAKQFRMSEYSSVRDAEEYRRSMKTPWKYIDNSCASFEEPIYEPGGLYLLNTSKRHGVLNYSYKPRYNGFFTISKTITYEDAREFLKETQKDG